MLVDLPRVLRELSARVKAEKNQWRRATDQKFYHETMETTLVGGRHVHSFVASKRVSLTGIIFLSSIPPFLDGRHLTRSLLHSLLPLSFFLFFPFALLLSFARPSTASRNANAPRHRTNVPEKFPGLSLIFHAAARCGDIDFLAIFVQPPPCGPYSKFRMKSDGKRS